MALSGVRQEHPISETLVENYFCFFICLLDRERFILWDAGFVFICLYC